MQTISVLTYLLILRRFNLDVDYSHLYIIGPYQIITLSLSCELSRRGWNVMRHSIGAFIRVALFLYQPHRKHSITPTHSNPKHPSAHTTQKPSAGNEGALEDDATPNLKIESCYREASH